LTGDLKAAVIEAAAAEGADGAGQGGLVGYLKLVARASCSVCQAAGQSPPDPAAR
jgi:hypothetical protein